MTRTSRIFSVCCIATSFAFSFPAGASDNSPDKHASSALWRHRGNIESLNLFYGIGGKDRQPVGKFTFVKEDNSGSSPKFEVVDGRGVHWKVKLGAETKSETAATRLVWAAGYFTDEDYYQFEIEVKNLPKLKRGHEFTWADGVVRGVRLERIVKEQKKIGNWSWFKNPFAGTKELDGLRIMMALINNWDLKQVNNAIYRLNGTETRYVVSDLGATFGETGDAFTRSRSNPSDYSETSFVQKVTPDHVDFNLKSRPFFLSAIHVPYYVERTRMQDVVKSIPLAHAKWLGKLLGQLSDQQILDCFRAAGYSPSEIAVSAAMVKERIGDLNRF